MPRFHTKEKTVLGRLLERTVKPDGEDGCWVWTGMTNKDGYGRLTVDKKTKQVHRLSFLLHKYEIPSTVLVLHKCDNPPCWNPDHLVSGTHADNSLDKVRKGRHSRGEQTRTARLTVEQVLDIRHRCSSGESRMSVARHYGVHNDTIRDIDNRKSWKDL